MAELTLEQRVDTFKRDLDSVTKELMVKRKELYQVNNQLKELSSELTSALDKKIEGLEAEIVRLDKIIAEKKVIADADSSARVKAFDERRADLETEYCIKNQSVAKREAGLSDRASGLDARERDLASRELEATQVISSAGRRNGEIDKKIADFEANKQRDLAQMAERQGILEARSANIDKLMDELVEAKSAVETKATVIANQEKEAKAVLARINEATGILAQAEAVKTANDRRGAELNDLHVKTQAEVRRMNIIKDQLIDLEYKIKEREKNIKAIEASLARSTT